jgi:hypothetical protein
VRDAGMVLSTNFGGPLAFDDCGFLSLLCFVEECFRRREKKPHLVASIRHQELESPKEGGHTHPVREGYHRTNLLETLAFYEQAGYTKKAAMSL